MKYTYAYKTSDGVRHEASLEAKSREDVFAALRKQGIRAIKVVAADGGKANGEVRGIRKRVVALATGVALAAGCIATYFVLGIRPTATGASAAQVVRKTASAKVAKPLHRQYISGNRVRLAATNVFGHATESFLARYAEPGVEVGPVPVTEELERDCPAALQEFVYVAADDYTEVVDLKRIVVGMKNELRAYLAAGGTLRDYAHELVRRQETECGYRQKAEERLSRMIRSDDDRRLQEAYAYWLKSNASLEAMGVRPLEIPNELRGFQLSAIELE